MPICLLGARCRPEAVVEWSRLGAAKLPLGVAADQELLSA